MKNLGSLDRIIRLAPAIAIVAAYAVGLISGTLALVMSVVAVVLLTSMTSTCSSFCPSGCRPDPRGVEPSTLPDIVVQGLL